MIAIALFHVPHAVVDRDGLLAMITAALSDFDLVPPSVAVLSQPALAARDGCWTFGLGARTDEVRLIDRGFFLDSFSSERPVVFVGVDPHAGTEVFEYRAEDRAHALHIVSRGSLLAGDVERLRVDRQRAEADGQGAAQIGRARVGLRAGVHSLDGAEHFVRDSSGSFRAAAPAPFVNLIQPGISAVCDPWPTRAIEKKAVESSGAPPMDVGDAMERLNDVGTMLNEGGDLEEALAIVERVLASLPKMTRALGLRGMILEQLGRSDLLEAALVHELEMGMEAAGYGEAQLVNVVWPAKKLAQHFLANGRAREALSLIDRASDLVHPVHAAELAPLRAQCAASGHSDSKK